MNAASSQAGLAAVRYGFHPGDIDQGPVPALVQLDRDEVEQRLIIAAGRAVNALRTAGPWTSAGGGAPIDEELAEALADFEAVAR